MAAADALEVWHCRRPACARRVGRLWRDDADRMGFRYDRQWVAAGFAISQQMPLARREYRPSDGTAHRFFANLLPEADARSALARAWGAPNVDFDLLRRVGGECAGALSLLPIGQQPAQGDWRYRELAEHELARLALRRGIGQPADLVPWPRLSLAGAQHKYPVLLRHGRCFVPLGEAASTHILKFELPGYRNVPLYETFTTYIAGAVGLPVADIEWRAVRRHRYTMAARFDRYVAANGEVHRRHQEDFCQALGASHTDKYETDGGPALADCLRLLRDASSDPATDMANLLRWQAFNWLAGNADGHAKNLALLHARTGSAVRLAPFYDLVCTAAIPGLSRNLAMSVAGESDLGQIAATHWRALAWDCLAKPRFVIELVEGLAESLDAAVGGCRRRFEERYGKAPALQRIERTVTRRCRRVLSGLWQERT